MGRPAPFLPACYPGPVRPLRARALAGPFVLAALASVHAAVAGHAPRPPDRPPSLGASLAANAGDGVVALRAAGPAAVLIPAGTFTMGSESGEVQRALEQCKREPLGTTDMPPLCNEAMFGVEMEAHEVVLSAYAIDRTEVTVAAFDRCVAAGRCAPPPYWAGGERFHRPELPVSLVTWDDAAAYCRFAGGRLPTEAEWERAARGPNRRRYPWGDVYNPRLANHGTVALDQHDDTDGYEELAPVASFPDGRTPDGIDDLAGNVAEWVADAIDEPAAARYPPASDVDPVRTGGAYRVVRGGGFRSGAAMLRGAAREFRLASTREPTIGFRCVHPAR